MFVYGSYFVQFVQDFQVRYRHKWLQTRLQIIMDNRNTSETFFSQFSLRTTLPRSLDPPQPEGCNEGSQPTVIFYEKHHLIYRIIVIFITFSSEITCSFITKFIVPNTTARGYKTFFYAQLS